MWLESASMRFPFFLNIDEIIISFIPTGTPNDFLIPATLWYVCLATYLTDSI